MAAAPGMKGKLTLSPLDRSICSVQKRRGSDWGSGGRGLMAGVDTGPPAHDPWPPRIPSSVPSHELPISPSAVLFSNYKMNIISINSVPLGRLFDNSSSTIVHSVIRA